MPEQVIDNFRGEYRFLSNFDQEPFYMRTLGQVRSGEHAFNALKTANPDQRAAVLATSTPMAAKKVGRQVTLRRGWDTGLRLRAMEFVLESKFVGPTFDRLFATRPMLLIEGNTWHDNYWGICTCPRCGRGQNMLGELLMKLRATGSGAL